jgi:hypothetical protein
MPVNHNNKSHNRNNSPKWYHHLNVNGYGNTWNDVQNMTNYEYDRESSSYSPDPYKQRGRYLHNRYSTDSQSSDSCKLSDSLLPCSDDQSQNRSEYLDEIDSYARARTN